MEHKRIVVTGIGVVSPIAVGCSDLVKALREGKSGISLIDKFDTTNFSVKFAGIVRNFDPAQYLDPKKIKRLASFNVLGLSAAKMALEDSGLDLSKEDKSRVGSVTGVGMGGLDVIEEQHSNLVNKGPRRVSPFLIPSIITNMLPGEIAIEYGITGPNYSVSSACASANHAMGAALRHLRYGDADVMITGGAESTITPLAIAGFSSLKALATDNEHYQSASKPFDKNRSGFVMGEGSAILVLETLEHALARGAKIYAEFAGYGATDDAFHMTAPDLKAQAPAHAMELAMKDANVSKEEVDYINAHGTSTHLNDLVETTAIKNVFGQRAYKIPVSSTKSMTGHLLGAAGALEAAATILCMQNGFIHPTINYQTPDPECDLDYVPNVARQQQITCALSNSLGFGGHNAAIIIKKYVG